MGLFPLAPPSEVCGKRFLTEANLALLTVLSLWKFFYVRQELRSPSSQPFPPSALVHPHPWCAGVHRMWDCWCFRPFLEVCHYCLIPDYFHSPKRTPNSLAVIPHFPLSPSLWHPLIFCLSLWFCLFWTFCRTEWIAYGMFCVGEREREMSSICFLTSK